MAYLVVIFSIFGAVRPSAAQASPPISFVMCRSLKVVRTIRVDATTEGCETVYTKSGVDKVVGSGKNRTSCLNFRDNVRRNLENSGWKCRDVSAASVSDGKN